MIVLQSSSLSLCYIFTFPQNGSCLRGAGGGEMGLRPIYWAIILSIMKQARRPSEHIPLALLPDESFSVSRVHLWPFSVCYFPVGAGNLQSSVALVSGRESPPRFITTEMLARFHSSEKLQDLTSLIKTLSITMPALISGISRCGVWLDCARLMRTWTEMKPGRLSIQQIKPQRRNSVGEGNHKETFKSKENRSVSAWININMS